jgi:type II secretory pathway component PulK
LEYHFDATVELDLATNYSEDVQAYYLAMAGVNFARAVLQQDDSSSDGAGDIWFRVGLVPVCVSPQQLLGLGATAGENGLLSTSGIPPASTSERSSERSTEEEETEHRDTGCVSLRIVDEAGKLPINALQPAGTTANADPDQTWQEIFLKFFEGFGIAEDTIEALVDWLDTDDEPRGSGGAENSYYEGLKTPYKAHNGPMFSAGELRIIRGFDAPAIAKLFPGVAEAAVADLDMGNNPYLTPYGGETTVQPPSETPDGRRRRDRSQQQQQQQQEQQTGGEGNPGAAKVNLNTAKPEVLQIVFAALAQESLESMKATVDDFIAERDKKELDEEHFKTLNEALQMIPGGAPNGLSEVADVKSTHFRVDATGKVGDIAKRVIAILKRDGSTVSMISFKIE